MFSHLSKDTSLFNFWPADWSQFIPDGILSVVSGVIIGIFLWRLQARAENSQARRKASAGWNIARHKVGAAMLVPFNRRGLIINFGQFPELLSRLKALMESKPFTTWADDAPDDVDLQAMAGLTETYYALEGLLATLERNIVTHLIGALPNLNGNYSPHAEYARAKIIGFDDPSKVLGVNFTPTFEEVYQDLLKEVDKDHFLIVVTDTLDLFERQYADVRSRVIRT